MLCKASSSDRVYLANNTRQALIFQDFLWKAHLCTCPTCTQSGCPSLCRPSCKIPFSHPFCHRSCLLQAPASQGDESSHPLPVHPLPGKMLQKVLQVLFLLCRLIFCQLPPASPALQMIHKFLLNNT